MSERTIEVLSVGTALEISTGKQIGQVQFGNYVKVDDGVRSRTKFGVTGPAGVVVTIPEGVEQIGSITLVLFYDFKGVAPYRLGSKWKLNINKDGEMSLSEVK